MSDIDSMQKMMSQALGDMSDAEKQNRIKMLQKRLDEEMKRRKMAPLKKPKK